MARIHILFSAERIENGQTLKAQCGAIVLNANAVPITNCSQPESSVIFCRKCFGQLYMYAITDGQTSRDLEAGVVQ